MRHELRNVADRPIELAPWSITQLPLGGTVLLPQRRGDAGAPRPTEPDAGPVAVHLLGGPALPAAGRAADARRAGRPDLKLGYFNDAGWVGYVRDGAVLIRRFEPLPGQPHPDLGCNVEVYIGSRFLELELLGPLTELAPGATIQLTERWQVLAVGADREPGGPAGPCRADRPRRADAGRLVTRPNDPAPRIPSVAWRWPMGQACPDVSHPHVSVPMIDDGACAGVPIGGLGTGSIGRTHRGDAARWHLEVGRHAFAPVAADGFAIYVGAPGGAGRATVLSTLRPSVLPAWGWTLPEGAGTYHALFPRAWHTFEPDVLGVRLTGEQLSPVIAGDLESSALPVGAFEWWVENPGPDPLTVGIMLTWQDPAADPDGPAHRRRLARDHRIDARRRGGPPRPAGAATGLRGTFALAASRAPGVTVTVRSRFDALADTELWADFAADGRLDPATTTGRAEPARRSGPPSPRRSSWPPANDARCASPSPGTCRSSNSVPGGSGGSATRATWGRTGARAFDLAVHALERMPAWREAIEAWQGPVLDADDRPDWYKAALFNELYYLVDGGTFWEAGEVGGPEPVLEDAGRFALLECLDPDYRYYDTVDVDFYASFAVQRLFPELEARGIRDLLAAVPGRRSRDRHDRSPRACRRARKVGGTVPHDLGGPDDDPFYRPNRYRYQEVSAWKDLGPKFVLQVWRDAVADPRRRRCPDPRCVADGRRRADAARPSAIATATGCPSTTAGRPDLRHLADARAVGVRRLALAGGGGGRRGDGAAPRG